MRCPAQFCELRSEFVFDPHVQTNVRLAFFIFSKKLWPIFMFRIVVYRIKKKDEFHVCCLVHDRHRVKKSNLNI